MQEKLYAAIQRMPGRDQDTIAYTPDANRILIDTNANGKRTRRGKERNRYPTSPAPATSRVHHQYTRRPRLFAHNRSTGADPLRRTEDLARRLKVT